METRATCPYCGVGCGVLIEHDGERITGVRGDPVHPANFGRLCTKGSTLHLSARPQTRLLHPELRRARGEPRQRVGWDEAIATAAGRFAEVINTHGPDAVAFYISGQLLTEDYYVFNKAMKGLIGSNNVDTNSRLCMSSAVAAYKQTLGADAPPCAYEDFDHADCILIAGANPAYAHPVAFRRIEDAKKARPHMKLIVVDPRRTDTAASADLHLAILPGTDIWLYNAMLHVLLDEGLIDADFIAAHTEGFDALREHVRDITPAAAAEVCGVPAADIVTAARWWGQSAAALSLWCQGLNQSTHGTHNGTALIALSLATGKIGKPGCGPFSLTGQPNAMGGREVGGLANLLSAHRDLANPAHREEVARLWGVDSVPATPGLTAVELFQAAREGRIKALWIACTNPAQSMPELELVREALQCCDFVVLQEAFRSTETAPFADLMLPAATWGEKEGTVTNSERRITHVRRALPPPGEARPDWRIVCDFARALGPLIGKPQATYMFAYDGVEAIFAEHVASTAGRDLDITGLDYALLDAAGPQQWPFPAAARAAGAAGRARLYADGCFPTASGRARFVVPVQASTAEQVDERYPLHLTTGRLRDQWHGMSRTGKVARLYSHVDEARIELNPAELQARGLRSGELLRVSSRRGRLVLRAYASDEVRRGQAFVAMHWGRNVLDSGGINLLVGGALDPFSKQPELKHTAIAIERAELPWQMLLMRVERDECAATEQAEALVPWLERFAYASLALAGRERAAVVMRVAHDQPIPPAWLAELDAVLGLDDECVVSYEDPRRGISKRALIEDERLVGLRLAGETLAGAWLRELMVEAQSTAALRRWLLAPLSAPPAAAVGRGRIVCNCLNVSENEIVAAIGAGADFDALQAQLACGTSCGSCVPEIRRMLTAPVR
ncbi:MAG TPA: molybdopterin-dependent oxidoreductase [Thauera sp.]|uniref:nitrate reductase n=1 Tax=Thauera sp. TaxID=1905334 RepID=UPI002B5F8BFF|nr:molybdopterin-dependent oxidoreductase [Thauera sp.]HRP23032.1 molybdopterin-dependent oxidoreductase [Thauera sp.]HRP64481.1 molybdopterin-dependent oxidoreductase [Thauera sp.]